MSAFALKELEAMKQRHAIIGDVRGLGLILGVELVRNRATMERDSDAADQVMYEALSRGLSFKVVMGNVLLLAPALTITREEMRRALRIIGESIAAVVARRRTSGIPKVEDTGRQGCFSTPERRGPVSSPERRKEYSPGQRLGNRRRKEIKP